MEVERSDALSLSKCRNRLENDEKLEVKSYLSARFAHQSFKAQGGKFTEVWSEILDVRC